MHAREQGNLKAVWRTPARARGPAWPVRSDLRKRVAHRWPAVAQPGPSALTCGTYALPPHFDAGGLGVISVNLKATEWTDPARREVGAQKPRSPGRARGSISRASCGR